MFTSSELQDRAVPFLQQMLNHLAEDGILISGYEVDHLCYRVETWDRYEDLKDALDAMGELLSEQFIGGRPIAVFKLNVPIVYQSLVVPCLELPAPKNGRFYAEGFEHIEIEIGQSLTEFMQQYPMLCFDTRALAKPINAEISRIYDDGTSVKFHEYSIERVIQLEANGMTLT